MSRNVHDERPRSARSTVDQAIRSVPWTLFSYGLDRGIGWISTVVLARLLEPRDFGLMAIAVLAIGLVNQFSGLGLGGALVLDRSLDRRGQGTVLTVLAATGVLSGGLVAALAPWIARAFNEPRLTPLLYALSGVVALTSFNWFHTTLLERELAFGRRFVAVGIQSVVSSVVAVVLAFSGAGVWSLVLGVVAGAVAYTVGLLLVTPDHVWPTFDRAAARRVMSVGRGFLLQNGASFLQQNVDYIVVGRTLGARPLGFYSMAYRLGELPQSGIAHPIAKVTFPAFVRIQHQGGEIRAAFLSALRFVGLVSAPIGLVISAAAGPFVHTVFGSKWSPAVGPVAVFGVWAVVRVVQVTFEWFLNSVGQAALVGRIAIGLALAHVPALVAAAVWSGITAVAWVMLAHICVTLVALMVAGSRVAHVPLRDQWRALRPIVLGSLAGWGAARAVVAVVSASAAIELVLSVVAGVIAYCAVTWAAEPSLPRSTVRLVARAMRRGAVRPASPSAGA
jgi:lipopolysaccharide exporter